MVKKLLLICLTFTAAYSYAQNVRISWEDDYSTPYNGEEVTISGGQSTIYTSFYVVNESSESTFIWRRDILSISSPGFEDQLCDDQICYTTSGISWICPGPLTIAANDSSLFQPKLLTNGNAGTAHIRYYVLDQNENKLDSIDVVFSSSASLSSSDVSEVNMFPNPAENSLTLENLSSSDKAIVIFDALGKEVLSKGIKSSSQSLSLSALRSGIYFVKIETSNGQLSEPKKLIVRK
jgi:hypothetical protein